MGHSTSSSFSSNEQEIEVVLLNENSRTTKQQHDIDIANEISFEKSWRWLHRCILIFPMYYPRKWSKCLDKFIILFLILINFVMLVGIPIYGAIQRPSIYTGNTAAAFLATFISKICQFYYFYYNFNFCWESFNKLPKPQNINSSSSYYSNCTQQIDESTS